MTAQADGKLRPMIDEFAKDLLRTMNTTENSEGSMSQMGHRANQFKKDPASMIEIRDDTPVSLPINHELAMKPASKLPLKKVQSEKRVNFEGKISKQQSNKKDNQEQSSSSCCHGGCDDDIDDITEKNTEKEFIDIEEIKRKLDYEIEHKDELIKKNYEPSITYSTSQVKPSIELLARYIEQLGQDCKAGSLLKDRGQAREIIAGVIDEEDNKIYDYEATTKCWCMQPRYICKNKNGVGCKYWGIKVHEDVVQPATLNEALYPEEMINGKPAGYESVYQVPTKLTKSLQVLQNEQKFANLGGFQKNFMWLIDHLTPPPETDHIYKGCELIFPDTAFFNAQGACVLITKLDKELCIKKIRSKDKHQPDAIHHAFAEAVWNRFRATEGHFEIKYGQSIFVTDDKEFERQRTQQKAGGAERKEKLAKEVAANVTSKDFASFTKTKANKTNLSKSMRSVASGGSVGRNNAYGAEARAESSALWAKEYAIFRWRELPHEVVNTMNSDLAAPPAKRDKSRGKSQEMSSTLGHSVQNGGSTAQGRRPAVEFLGEKQFYEALKGSNKADFKALELLQTCVKRVGKINMDSPIVVNFFAPINLDEPLGPITYDYAALGGDEELIRNNEERYCLKQVYKMCYYVAKLHMCEILRMRCEFVKDYHGTIWFQYASNIWMRPNLSAQKESEEADRIKRKLNEDRRAKLAMEIQTHVNCPHAKANVNKLEAAMEAEYQAMRKKAGIGEVLDNSDGSDYETEQVFKQLHPDANYKLMDLLTGKVKPPKPKLYRRKTVTHDKKVKVVSVNESQPGSRLSGRRLLMSKTSSVNALHAPRNPNYQYHSTFNNKGKRVPRNMMIIRTDDENELHGHVANEATKNYLSKRFDDEFEERIFNQDHPRLRDAAAAAEEERRRNEEQLALFSRESGPPPEVVTKVVDMDAMTEAQKEKMFFENQNLQRRRSHYGRKGFGLLERKPSQSVAKSVNGSTAHLPLSASVHSGAPAPPAIIRSKESERANDSVVDIRVQNESNYAKEINKFARLLPLSPGSLTSKHTVSNVDYNSKHSTAAWSKGVTQGHGQQNEFRPQTAPSKGPQIGGKRFGALRQSRPKNLRKNIETGPSHSQLEPGAITSPVSMQGVFELRGLQDSSQNMPTRSDYLSGLPSSKAAGGVSIPQILPTSNAETLPGRKNSSPVTNPMTFKSRSNVGAGTQLPTATRTHTFFLTSAPHEGEERIRTPLAGDQHHLTNEILVQSINSKKLDGHQSRVFSTTSGINDAFTEQNVPAGSENLQLVQPDFMTVPKTPLDRLDADASHRNRRERPMVRGKPVAASQFFTKDANQAALQQQATYVGNGRYSHLPTATINASQATDLQRQLPSAEATEEYEVVHAEKASSVTQSMMQAQVDTCSEMSPVAKGRTQLGDHASRATRETLHDEAYERRHREYGQKLKHNSTAYKGLHSFGRNFKQNTTGGGRIPRNISSANPYKRQSQMHAVGKTLRNNVAFQEFTDHRQALQKSQQQLHGWQHGHSKQTISQLTQSGALHGNPSGRQFLAIAQTATLSGADTSHKGQSHVGQDDAQFTIPAQHLRESDFAHQNALLTGSPSNSLNPGRFREATTNGSVSFNVQQPFGTKSTKHLFESGVGVIQGANPLTASQTTHDKVEQMMALQEKDPEQFQRAIEELMIEAQKNE